MPYTPPDHLAPLPDATLLRARERAIALLTDRYADETLSEGEFEARLNWLTTAEDPRQIESLAAELSSAGTLRAAAGHPIARAPREQRILSVLSNTSRTGRWTMPATLAVRAMMSEVKLDLRYASLPAQCEIEVVAVMANVRVILPPGVFADCRISPFMGTVSNRADDAAWTGQDGPHLVLSGVCVMSEVRVDVDDSRHRSWQDR